MAVQLKYWLKFKTEVGGMVGHIKALPSPSVFFPSKRQGQTAKAKAQGLIDENKKDA